MSWDARLELTSIKQIIHGKFISNQARNTIYSLLGGCEEIGEDIRTCQNNIDYSTHTANPQKIYTIVVSGKRVSYDSLYAMGNTSNRRRGKSNCVHGSGSSSQQCRVNGGDSDRICRTLNCSINSNCEDHQNETFVGECGQSHIGVIRINGLVGKGRLSICC